MDKACSARGEKGSVLVGQPEGKKQLGRRRRRQDTMKAALKETAGHGSRAV
jgi:hypothetical protein